MERELVDDWIEGYRRAWEQADTPAAVALFTADASYRSHPLRPAHAGHDGIAAYWSEVTAEQREPRVRFGDPIVDGDRVAVEWWTTLLAGGDPITLAGCLVLAFAADGRCRDLRECWNLAEGRRDPAADWGRLDPATGQAGVDPAARDRVAGHARRWAEGYARAWRATDPDAAAALYAPGALYRSEPFRDPHLGREGVLAYTRDAYATEADQDPRFGAPFAAAGAAAVEWWTTLLEEGQPASLIGISLLTFAPDGLVARGRDYWFQEAGAHPPFQGWGR
jgi:predicted SnoaL-like aldol condensation-catalyzing enzyme